MNIVYEIHAVSFYMGQLKRLVENLENIKDRLLFLIHFFGTVRKEFFKFLAGLGHRINMASLKAKCYGTASGQD